VRVTPMLALGFTIGVQAAIAADARGPIPVPVLVEPQASWAGLYIGANVGYGRNRAIVADSFSAPGFGALGATTFLKENLNGGIWGGQIGYNWQFGHVVAGVEADFNGTGQLFNEPFVCDVGGTIVPGCTVFPRDRIRWFATARARLGFAVDRWLLYVTGGPAVQNLGSDGHVAVANVGGWDVFSTSTTRVGYSIGAGAEAALFGKWSLGMEYLFIDTGTKTTGNVGLPAGLNAALGAPPGTMVFETHRLSDQIVRLRLNFRP
jgi:outer membrane immunogenic protein